MYKRVSRLQRFGLGLLLALVGMAMPAYGVLNKQPIWQALGFLPFLAGCLLAFGRIGRSKPNA